MKKSPTQTTRSVFIVSDGTGITAEAMARSIITQFDGNFTMIHLPFIDTTDKADQAMQTIQKESELSSDRPIVFSTLVRFELSSILRQANALHLDLIQTFVEPLTKELGTQSKQEIGLSHQSTSSLEYKERIDAIHFSIMHDDGQSNNHLDESDVIILGVSRCGKTPTSLYLAVQYGLKVANYPLIPEDFDRGHLPAVLTANRTKLFGLSIDPKRLAEIRHERLPDSRYASIENCEYEVRAAETMMQKEGIHWLSSTSKSIEEIASSILHARGMTHARR